MWRKKDFDIQTEMQELANEMGVEIPGDISIHLWPVPIFKKLHERLKVLEEQVHFLQFGNPNGE